MFLCSETIVKDDQGADYGAELSALANGWKDHFGGVDPHFFYTTPSKALAPKITRPKQIRGKSTAFEVNQLPTSDAQLQRLIDQVVGEVYE